MNGYKGSASILNLGTGNVGKHRCMVINNTNCNEQKNGSMIQYATARQMGTLLNALPCKLQRIRFVSKVDTFQISQTNMSDEDNFGYP